MADGSDVEAALVTLAASALYPLGTEAASVTGDVYRLYRGWPGNAALENDLAAGISHISVASSPGTQVAIEQFPAVWEVPAPVTSTLTVSTAGSMVAFGGVAKPGLLAGILADDVGFAYRTRTGDTTDLVAASLAALINKVRVAAVQGPTVMVPGTSRLIGRVVADQTSLMPTRRQRAEFRVTCWCGNSVGRDATTSAIDLLFSQTAFLVLEDNTAARLNYVRSATNDELSALPMYRRELTYNVDYATTLVQLQPSMLFGVFSADGVGGTSILHLS